MRDDLIIDVGMNNGDDSALYLSKGFQVVAIEANPVLAERAAKRFPAEIADGRLTILNVGIGPAEGRFEFWVNDENDEHSSLLAEFGGRDGTRCHRIEIPCVRFESVLEEHGVPFYLKVDIEGADVHCLHALRPEDKPRYVSVEAHRLEYLCILRGLGYDRFKCIDQLSHNYQDHGASNESLRRRFERTTKHHWRRFNRRVLHRMPSRNGYRFPIGSSGPFGEDTDGEWKRLEEVAYDWLHFDLGYKKRGTLNNRSWFDFHATSSGS